MTRFVGTWNLMHLKSAPKLYAIQGYKDFENQTWRMISGWDNCRKVVMGSLLENEVFVLSLGIDFEWSDELARSQRRKRVMNCQPNSRLSILRGRITNQTIRKTWSDSGLLLYAPQLPRFLWTCSSSSISSNSLFCWRWCATMMINYSIDHQVPVCGPHPINSGGSNGKPLKSARNGASNQNVPPIDWRFDSTEQLLCT